MCEFDGATPVKVLLLGEEQAGKTSLARLIASYENAADSIAEDLSWKRSLQSLHHAARHIGKTTGGIQRAEVSLEGGAKIHFVDMPGAQNREGSENEGLASKTHMRHIKEAIRHTDYLNCAIFVVDGKKMKMPVSARHELQTVAEMMPTNFMDKIIVLATHCDAPQRRVLPVSELLEAFGREPLVTHIDNCLGHLSSLTEAQVKQIVKDHDPSKDNDETPAAEIRRGVRKSLRATSELLRMIKPFPPTIVPASEGLSFNYRNLRDVVEMARDQATSFTDARDPGYSASLEAYVRLFLPPALTGEMFKDPFVGLPDWREMFEAWNVINVTAMVLASVLYILLETLLDVAAFSFFAFIGSVFERVVFLILFAIFSHLTWYMTASRRGLCGPFICLGPHYFLVVAAVFICLWLECILIAEYKIFFFLVAPPTLYLCFICIKLFLFEEQARDLTPVRGFPSAGPLEATYDLQDLEMVHSPSTQPLAT